MNRWITPLIAVLLTMTVFLPVAGAEPCSTENCSMSSTAPAEQKPVVRSNYPKLAPAQGPTVPPVERQPEKTTPVATPPPLPARTETVTRQQTAQLPQGDPAKGRMLSGFEEAPAFPGEDGAPPGLQQTITPEGPSHVVLSSSDINRIICPTDIRDTVYSKEKGLTVRLSGQNAFVKFLVMKKDGKDLYATTPSELYVVCGDNVYTMIAVPRRIPAQTVQLSAGKADLIRKNMRLFSEVPFEKKIITIVRKIYTANVPNSFTVRKIGKPYPLFQGLSLVLHSIITIDGEGLTVKEYRARIMDGSKENSVTLREKDFLTTELAQRPVAVSIDTMNLKRGETSRIFVVERTGGES